MFAIDVMPFLFNTIYLRKVNMMNLCDQILSQLCLSFPGLCTMKFNLPLHCLSIICIFFLFRQIAQYNDVSPDRLSTDFFSCDSDLSLLPPFSTLHIRINSSIYTFDCQNMSLGQNKYSFLLIISFTTLGYFYWTQ